MGQCLIRLDKQNQPALFKKLNDGESVVLDDSALCNTALYQPNARITDVMLEHVTVEHPDPGEKINLSLELTLDKGTVRHGGALYRLCGEPGKWSFPVGGTVAAPQVTKSRLGPTYRDVLKLLTGDSDFGGDSLKRPVPVWSEATLRLGPGLKKFSLSSLDLCFHYEYEAVDLFDGGMLVLRAMLLEENTETDRAETPLRSVLLGCDTDINGRSYGLHNSVRFFRNRSDITLNASVLEDDFFAFSHWHVEHMGSRDQGTRFDTPAPSFAIRRGVTFATCYFTCRALPGGESVGAPEE